MNKICTCLAIFSFVTLTSGISLARNSQSPIVQIPILMTSPSEIASRAPQTGETAPHYINRVSVKGPTKIEQASFDFPKDYLFVPGVANCGLGTLLTTYPFKR
jgi:hypothetical protein